MDKYCNFSNCGTLETGRHDKKSARIVLIRCFPTKMILRKGFLLSIVFLNPLTDQNLRL
jgi:hypothetical protein